MMSTAAARRLDAAHAQSFKETMQHVGTAFGRIEQSVSPLRCVPRNDQVRVRAGSRTVGQGDTIGGGQ